MKLFLSILAGVIFLFFVYIYFRQFKGLYLKKLDSISKSYGYRDYKNLIKNTKKEEKIYTKKMERKRDSERRNKRHG